MVLLVRSPHVSISLKTREVVSSKRPRTATAVGERAVLSPFELIGASAEAFDRCVVKRLGRQAVLADDFAGEGKGLAAT